MNSVTIIGTLTSDPEMRNGKTKVCSMRLVEMNGPKDSALFIDVAAFGRQAETCGKYLKNGRHVAVSGRLRFREWETEEGGKRSQHSIAADRVDFLPGGERRTSGEDEGGESE